MIGQQYKVDKTVLKTNKPLTLWKNEKGIVEIDENTLAVPIKLGDQQRGYAFKGNGKLLLDTIVETKEGAVGKPVEKELKDIFLMLGDTEETQQNLLSPADKEDLKNTGYRNEEELVAKAENLLNQLQGHRRTHIFEYCSDKHEGLIFAFPNGNERLDVLIAKGSKIVYKATDKVFISNKHKAVLKTPTEVVVIKNCCA